MAMSKQNNPESCLKCRITATHHPLPTYQGSYIRRLNACLCVYVLRLNLFVEERYCNMMGSDYTPPLGLTIISSISIGIAGLIAIWILFDIIIRRGWKTMMAIMYVERRTGGSELEGAQKGCRLELP